jgi:hypothetical protein
MSADRAEQAKNPGLVPSLLGVAGELESPLRKVDGLIDLTGQEIALAQIGDAE